MSDLRAPDPTLTAYIAEGWSIVLTDYTDDTPVAHRIDAGTGHPPCGHRDDDDAVSLAKYARWFAVPCRECFPTAPPPGRRTYVTKWGAETTATTADCFLDWQVAR